MGKVHENQLSEKKRRILILKGDFHSRRKKAAYKSLSRDLFTPSSACRNTFLVIGNLLHQLISQFFFQNEDELMNFSHMLNSCFLHRPQPLVRKEHDKVHRNLSSEHLYFLTMGDFIEILTECILKYP